MKAQDAAALLSVCFRKTATALETFKDFTPDAVNERRKVRWLFIHE